MKYLGYLIGLCITVIVEIFIYRYIVNKSIKRSQLVDAFKSLITCMTLWCIGLIIQILIINFTTINPLYIDYFIYFPVVFTPVAFFYVSYSYVKNKPENKIRKFLFLSIVPVITLLVLWTNDRHHLFYKVYSINPDETRFGPYFYVHSIYTYGLFFVDLLILIKNAIKKSGMFSAQSLLLCSSVLIPVTVNILGMTVFKMNIYVTPISFTFSIILIAIAIFKYNFLDVAPIALQRIVNQMSDLYIVLNNDLVVSDCNEPFSNCFGYVKSKIIGKTFADIHLDNKIEIIEKKNFGNILSLAQVNEKIYTINARTKDKSKYFTIEISGIVVDGSCVGILMLFSDITQHVLDLEEIKKNQASLMERERLATLGQMVGGIAHNLKTPIMSISGAMEGLNDLINEYDKSIDDPEVTKDDHHAIASDMREWIQKVNSYDSYMNDIITAVKGQAVNFNTSSVEEFTIDTLLKDVTILMKHELKNALIELSIECKIDKNTKLIGNVNALVQVVNNLISNAIQSYNGKQNESIVLTIYEKNNNIIIDVVDHGCGIPKDVQEKLFNKMVTTKGHNGTGLGLFMSYSTIKGNFNGNLSFKSKVNEGTTFTITLPKSK